MADWNLDLDFHADRPIQVEPVEDQNDHDSLRTDAVFKLIADRLPGDDDLASQPTHSRFENSVVARDLLNLEAWFLKRFVESFEDDTREITLDVDLFDDPTLGTDVEIRRVVSALRERFPDVRIHLRADSGFAAPRIYGCLEELRVDYTIGIGMNKVLKRQSDELLDEAVRQFEETEQPQRLFTRITYQAGSWLQARQLVIKCEAGPNGTNRRAVVTNRPGVEVLPQGVYDEYAERGESENRNKELKCELSADRLSDHRYMANCFRMFMHCLAYGLLLEMRRRVASPPPDRPIPDPPCPYLEPHRIPHEIPGEASSDRTRRRRFNLRRQADPLGEGHACTWRMMLIKVASRIVVQTRRVRVLLSGSWPFLQHFQSVGENLVPDT